MKFLKAIAVASLLAVAPIAVLPASAANVVETASSAGSFGTLLAAAQAAGLADALATTANITVFAPTDEAFAALPAGTVEDLLKPENKDKLVAILTAHVVAAKVMAGDIAEGTTEVATLNPAVMLKVTKDANGVTVALSNSAKVVSADVGADNGVIHVIDAVLLP
ncbi:fasciclin domain-containing protein [Devosia sp.]|uniref:fasciclin domain-containing protein n=1 Tax=Devosia sp. TaxID=1871048 RepID=UPI0035B30506